MTLSDDDRRMLLQALWTAADKWHRLAESLGETERGHRFAEWAQRAEELERRLQDGEAVTVRAPWLVE
jgi:hypothetical protein